MPRKSPIENIIKFPIVLITIGALILGFFCFGMFSKSATHMPMLGNTQSISMASEQQCCGTSISHHFNTWKNITLAVPDKVRDSLMLLALGLALGINNSKAMHEHSDKIQPKKLISFQISLGSYLLKLSKSHQALKFGLTAWTGCKRWQTLTPCTKLATRANKW
jgi:hypothetical protein